VTLLFDTERDFYVGESLSVTAAAFTTAVDILVNRGADEARARCVLLDEECRSTVMDGVSGREGPSGLKARLETVIPQLDPMFLAQRLAVVALAAGVAFALVIVLARH
jgi:hypothetical protein